MTGKVTLPSLKVEQSGTVRGPHLDLIPMGRIDLTALSVIAANLQVILGLNTKIHHTYPEPDYAFLMRRGQYDAGKIIQTLGAFPGGAEFRLAVVNVDLFTPIVTFVFGESQLGGKIAIISLFRIISQNQEKTYARSAKIALHEIGHLLGITHCRTLDCLMGFSHDLVILDKIPLRFCPSCEYEARRCLRSLFG